MPLPLSFRTFSYKVFFFLRSIKLTVLKRTIQGHLAHSRSWAAALHPPIRQLPPAPAPGTTDRPSVSVDVCILAFFITAFSLQDSRAKPPHVKQATGVALWLKAGVGLPDTPTPTHTSSSWDSCPLSVLASQGRL